MKKAFTLLEVLIVISLFAIISIFMYRTLAQTKLTNKIFQNQENKLISKNHLHKIFFEDIAESTSIEIYKDKKNNSILRITTTNTFHNAFYNYVTYMLNEKNELIRIESKNKFKKKEDMQDYFNNSFIDNLEKNIEVFEVAKNKNNYLFAIKQKNKDIEYFSAYKIR